MQSKGQSKAKRAKQSKAKLSKSKQSKPNQIKAKTWQQQIKRKAKQGIANQNDAATQGNATRMILEAKMTIMEVLRH